MSVWPLPDTSHEVSVGVGVNTPVLPSRELAPSKPSALTTPLVNSVPKVEGQTIVKDFGKVLASMPVPDQ